MDGLITPEGFFFVRNNSVSLDVAVGDWSLSITGDAVRSELAMSYDDVLGMNGATLPRDHGYPLRVLVPGWVGSTSIKWLSRIVVSAEQQWARNNTTSYVLIGDAYPPEGQAEGTVATTQTIKSALALPWPAELDAGEHRIGGYAHSPAGGIAAVEWSDDSGNLWHESQLVGPQARLGWARFEFTWEASSGRHTVMTRATDAAGNTQPDQVPFNRKGYLFNQPVPHPINVV